MSWNKMKKAKEEGGNSLFLKLKDGDSIEGVFRGEPHPFYQAYQEREEHESWAEGRSFKFKINFLVNEGGKWTAKIYQGGATVRDLLLDAMEEYGLDCIFKIKRTGSNKEDTRYSILFKGNLTPEQLNAVNAVELKPLTSKPSVREQVEDDDIPPPSDNDVPF